jgi:uncharacterized protein YndB with AHSA1/START domain
MSEDRSDLVESTEVAPEGITIVRVFDATREEVFGAWTVPERFARWFGMHGSDVPAQAATLDVRPGGEWRVTMDLGDDGTKDFWGEYREVDEPSRLVLTLTDTEPEPDARDEIVTIELEDLGDGRTRMTFTQLGGNLDVAEYGRARDGWLLFFERQQDLLKSRHDELKARHDQEG